MAEDLDLGDDQGYVTVSAGGASVRLDLWQVSNQLHDYYAKNKDKPTADYNAGLVDFVEGLGLPRCSHHMAYVFTRKIQERVEELKKRDEPSPASLASTT